MKNQVTTIQKVILIFFIALGCFLFRSGTVFAASCGNHCGACTYNGAGGCSTDCMQDVCVPSTDGTDPCASCTTANTSYGVSCSGCCIPHCGTPSCGQSNGCGGTCSGSDVHNWSAWSCGGCYWPGSCGPYEYVHDCTRSDPCGNTESKHEGCGSYSCMECGPHYAAWGACTAPTFTRSRSYNMDCAAAGVQTETCYGQVSGVLFDASVVSNCSTIAVQPKVSGAGVTFTGTVNSAGTFSTTTDANGAYTRSQLLIPETYTLSYTVDPAKWVADPPKLLCDGPLAGISLTVQGQAVVRRIGLYRIYGGWFQAEGGDIYGHTGITDTIPATCALAENVATCNSYDAGGGTYATPLIVVGSGGQPGSAISGSGSVDLGGGGDPAPNAVISSTGWNAGSQYAGKQTSYDYFTGNMAHYSAAAKQNWDGTGKPTGSESFLYQSTVNGTLTIDGSVVSPGAGEKIVIFHNGDVSITGDITTPVGSYFAIIASGAITVQSNVQTLQGVFIGDSIHVPSSGNKGSEVRLSGEGTFVGWNGILLARDRGSTNNTQSSEYFKFRPDFVVNAPFGLRLPQIRWKEVNP